MDLGGLALMLYQTRYCCDRIADITFGVVEERGSVDALRSSWVRSASDAMDRRPFVLRGLENAIIDFCRQFYSSIGWLGVFFALTIESA